jgi:hypothetical protein
MNDDYLSKHEKFFAFILLGLALFAIAVMVYAKPPSVAAINGAGLAILNTIVGALTLAFGGAAGALFKISDTDKKAIGQAAADAVSNGPPLDTNVVNTEAHPVPTSSQTNAPKEELPEYAR